MLSWTCQKCKQQEQKRRYEQQVIQEQQRRAFLRNRFELSKYSVVPPHLLSLCDAVYYLSVIRAGAAEDFSYIEPTDNFTTRLTPSDEFDRDVLVHLYQKGLIAIHPDSRTDAFSINGDDVRYNPRSVIWVPLVADEPGAVHEAIELLELVFQYSVWPKSWNNEWQTLGKKIALEESLQYLLHSLDEHHLPLKVGEKTILTLNLALDYYSVAQVYNFIWRAVRDAAAFYQRGGVTAHHAANTVIGAIQRMVERSRDEGWEVKAYGRSFALPRSMISQVFFSTALHMADSGFTLPPRDWAQPEAIIIEEEPLAQKVTEISGASPQSTSNPSQRLQYPNRGERSRRAKNRKKRKR